MTFFSSFEVVFNKNVRGNCKISALGAAMYLISIVAVVVVAVSFAHFSFPAGPTRVVRAIYESTKRETFQRIEQ